ncbi:MAG TPA: GDSL-type esterase/lipase family protein [Mycobacterium sp.]|nr:GDSL-type esterase/lipase family protein [Mycobacterium sp.]
MTKRVVCAGDSNTRGQYGVGYVPILTERLCGGDVTVTAAGVNGDCSFDLLRRLDSIIALAPDVVTVLIGTNDAWCTLSEANARRMMKRKKLPEAPTLSRFRDHLQTIAVRLSAETDARIALVSPPVLGQDLDGPATRAGAEFSEAIKEVAAQHDLAYLPLHERQCETLRCSGVKALPFPGGLLQRYTSVLQHYLLGRSYDGIARRRGLVLTSDHVHQNSRGAAMIADLIEGFLHQALTQCRADIAKLTVDSCTTRLEHPTA